MFRFSHSQRLLLGQFIPDVTYQTHAFICERFSMKIGRRSMKFSMKRTRGGKRVRLRYDCDAAVPYSSSYRRTRVSRTHPV
ncbi:hypothetical protein Y032_0052g2189 [Ancylostoma ceylanicum]|uniref:Uncharacterized protein n=1 Tax=Ancylostoma ceylanicum TaxID=53326 RepID=A0A016U6Y9_9BILA|nr:hypothetical protein Y032_0052g2189 [Ancylostoma ceylanicum]